VTRITTAELPAKAPAQNRAAPHEFDFFNARFDYERWASAVFPARDHGGQGCAKVAIYCGGRFRVIPIFGVCRIELNRLKSKFRELLKAL
jgi:hypothetical protein